MKKMMICLILISLTVFTGCRRDQKGADSSQSMEQIHKAAGIPVKTNVVRNETFTTILKYSATLRARSEAVRYSRVSDVVQQVFNKVGDYVRENQTVITFPKNNQTTQYYQLKANYDLAARTYHRMEQLYKEGVISKQELDNARANYEVARANINITDDSLRVKAPLSGYITQLNVKPTDNVSDGDPLFTVSNLNLIEAQIWASSQEIERIKLGQKVVLSWNGMQFEGSISQVGQIMDSDKKAFEVKALFKNRNNILTSGITADIAIETYSNEHAVTVQRKNLIIENGKSFIYVVKNGVAIKRQIQVGKDQGNKVEVKSGLKSGDILIVEGSKTVSDRAKVKVINS